MIGEIVGAHTVDHHHKDFCALHIFSPSWGLTLKVPFRVVPAVSFEAEATISLALQEPSKPDAAKLPIVLC
ncbi:hypothetical protein BQ8482_290096 [Mesorhizobium delmotii]|uniref:Uncharacterized protein n=1 Tax=Mesorhizobium delmotii TaxID=1631247 RepID=A0A2P9AMZ9_9HYPH|nr:hypothetical protein BQ8482_290096 [Mesorhizobium delmotii]